MSISTRLGWILLVAWTALSLAEPPAHAGVAESFVDAFNRGKALHDQGHPRDALRYYERALELAPRAFGENAADTAAICNNLANAYRDLGQFEKSEPLYLRCLKIQESRFGRDHVEVAFALNSLGLLYAELNRFEEAEPLFLRSLKIREAKLGPQHADVGMTLNCLGAVYADLGQYAKAEPLLQRSLKIKEATLGPDDLGVAQCLYNLAELHEHLGKYAQARPLYQRCLKIREAKLGRDHFVVSYVLRRMAILHVLEGNLAAAEPLHLRSLQIKENSLGADHPGVADTLNDLANLYKSLGRPQKAEPLYQRCLQIYEAKFGPAHPNVSAPLNNLANLYADAKEYDKAEPLYQRSLQIKVAKLGEDHVEVAQTINNLAWMYASQARYADAEPLYQRSLKIREDRLGPGHPQVANSLSNLADLYASQGDFEQAAPLYERSLTIKEASLGPDHPDVSPCLYDSAWLAMARNDLPRAAEYVDRCRHIDRLYVSRMLPVLAESEQRAFLKHADQEHWHLALTIALDGHDHVRPDASAEWVLNGKGVGPEALAQRALLSRDSRDPKTGELVRQLSECRRQLSALSLAAPRAGQEQARQKQIDDLAQQEETLSHRLGQVLGDQPRREPWIGIDEIRRAIPADGVLIEIVRCEVADFLPASRRVAPLPPRYAAWIIPPAGDRTVRLVDLGESEAIDRAVALVRQQLGRCQAVDAQVNPLLAEGEGSAEASLHSALGALSARILHPLLPEVGDARQLLVSPDGALWLAPWSALPLADGRYAVEQYAVRCIVSGRDLTFVSAPHKLNRPMMFADPDFDLSPDAARQALQKLAPARQMALNLRGTGTQLNLPDVARLPGTAVEAQSIIPALKKRGGEEPWLYQGRQALEGVCKLVRQPQLLMLSTHGFFFDDQNNHSEEANANSSSGSSDQAESPLLRCGLLLAGCNQRAGGNAGDDDGVLTGLEIVGMDLRGTELVVLSACETGLGQVRNGEGVAGLRQAFQLAGAQGVVSTLWQIPDRESAQLMIRFFENLASGQDHANSLRAAQISLIESRRAKNGAAHPFFWAAFTLTGK